MEVIETIPSGEPEGVSNLSQPQPQSQTSEQTSETNDNQTRKRVLSKEDGHNDENETKKQKTGQSEGTAIGIDNDTVFAMFQSLSSQMSDMYIDLTKRISNMETNLENKLTQKMKSSMDVRFGEVRKEMSEKITEVRNEVETRVDQLTRSYAQVTEGKDINSSKSIVIKMLPEKRGEPNDADATKHNVNALIRDGLRLRDIKIVSAKRKQNKNSRNPGVVTVTLETKEQKEKVMKEKRKLKSCDKYRKVYIEEEMSKEQLSADQNMRTILKETGIDRDYYVQNGNIRKRSSHSGHTRGGSPQRGTGNRDGRSGRRR